MRYDYWITGIFGASSTNTMAHTLDFSFRYGRSSYIDVAQPGTGQINIINWPTSSWTAGVGIGSAITIYCAEQGTGVWQKIWIGYIRDINQTYNVKAGGDIITVDLISPAGLGGAYTTTTYSGVVNQGLWSWLSTQFGVSGGVLKIKGRGTSSTVISPSNATDIPVPNVVQYIQNTEQGFVQDNNDFLNIHSRFQYAAQTGSGFTDVDGWPGSSGNLYDSLGGAPASSTYYKTVTLTPQTLSAVTKIDYARPDLPTLQLTTLDANSTQAGATANMLLAKFNVKTPTKAVVSFPLEAQHTGELIDLIEVDPSSNYNQVIGQKQTLTFRGSTEQVCIEGVQFTASPAGSRLSLNISDRYLNPFLVLNDSYWGKLNEGQLA